MLLSCVVSAATAECSMYSSHNHSLYVYIRRYYVKKKRLNNQKLTYCIGVTLILYITQITITHNDKEILNIIVTSNTLI